MHEHETGRFQAVDDDGNEYTIVEIQEYESAADFNDPHAVVPAMRRLETLDGEEVITLDGELCLRSTHQILRKLSG